MLGCKKKAIQKNWIEDVVVKYTATQVLTDAVISRIADAIVIIVMYFDAIAKIIAERTGCDVSAVKPESTFTEHFPPLS